MSYCDDCILLDICGKEGCCDEAMTFCADKNKFIHVSVFDKIRAEIEQEIAYKPMEMWDYRMGMTKALDIIDKYKTEREDKEC